MQNQELLDAINTATNDLATRIANWQTSIGTLTPAQEAEGKAIIATLNALAANPSEPVPPPVEAEPTT